MVPLYRRKKVGGLGVSLVVWINFVLFLGFVLVYCVLLKCNGHS